MDELDGDPEPRLTAEEIQQHFSLLPALCDLLAALENQQGRSEIVRVASKLSDKIAGAFALLEAMPGADCTVQEQHLLLEQKQATLEKKTKQLEAQLAAVDALIQCAPFFDEQ